MNRMSITVKVTQHNKQYNDLTMLSTWCKTVDIMLFCYWGISLTALKWFSVSAVPQAPPVAAKYDFISRLEDKKTTCQFEEKHTYHSP